MTLYFSVTVAITSLDYTHCISFAFPVSVLNDELLINITASKVVIRTAWYNFNEIVPLVNSYIKHIRVPILWNTV